MRQMSPQGRAVLRELEGCANIPYRDIAGLLTIGVGHCLTKSELASTTITLRTGCVLNWTNGGLNETQIDALLRDDCTQAEQTVNGVVLVLLTQAQYDALVCFVFNIGSSAFRRSTLLTRLNAGDYAAVPGELARWNTAGGKVVRGLSRRRDREALLWSSAVLSV